MNYCLNCGVPTKTKFCSRSCSATFNNKLRRPRTLESRLKTSNTLKITNASKVKPKLICKCCGKEYTLEKGINTKLFCSRECHNYYAKNRKQFLSKDTLEKLSKAGRKSAYIQSENKRSKNEIYFYELCAKYFNNVIHNEPIFNGWDADVIIEDIKVAILWNGPWHYKQIKNKQSLKQIQNRDKIKISEIINSNYEPYIIKDMGSYNKDFVEEKFEEFLKYSGVEQR